MKRIDDLTGATVTRVEVGRGGTLRIFLEYKRDTWSAECEWSPLIVEIPREPKKRRRAPEAGTRKP